LEHKVKASMDWAAQFRKTPMTMIGIAFGGGVLISTVFGKGQHSRRQRQYGPYQGSSQSDYRDASGQEHGHSRGATYQKQKAMDIWDNMKGALIGVAATKFRTFLDEAVPGFAEQY